MSKFSGFTMVKFIFTGTEDFFQLLQLTHQHNDFHKGNVSLYV